MRVSIIRISDFTNRTKTCKVVVAKIVSDSDQERSTLKDIGTLITKEFKVKTSAGDVTEAYFLVVTHPSRLVSLLDEITEREVSLFCSYADKVYVGYAHNCEDVHEDGTYNHIKKEVKGLSVDGEKAILGIIGELIYFR